MNDTLRRWNNLPEDAAKEEIRACCGSQAWARAMVAKRPFADEGGLFAEADAIWRGLSEADWMEAFLSHPRIGEKKASSTATAQSAAWSSDEQKKVASEDERIKAAIAEGNHAYEERFGRIFIVCATGKTGSEILEILRRRLQNEEARELQESAEEQRKITQIRLRKWLTG